MIFKANDIKKFEELNSVDLPNDTSSETGLIGTLLCNPEFILKSDYLQPVMFYNRELGCIYNVVNDLSKKGISDIDTFLITNEINSNKGYKEIFDNLDNIKDISDHLENLQMVARNNIEDYNLLAGKIITSSFKRDSYIKLEMMKKNILDSKDDINKLNYDMQNDITDFSKTYIVNKEVLTLGEQADAIWDSITGKRNGGVFGLPSKFSYLNNYTTYQKTEALVVASPGKTGKSQFLANETWNMVANGVSSCYIDRELSTENHMIRFLAYLTGIESSAIKNGTTTLIEEKLIREKLNLIKTLPYTHIYKPISEMSEMYMLIKGLKLKQGIDFLSYDYIKANDGSDGDKEYQKLGRLADWLKNDIAGSLDIAVATATQMDDMGSKVADSQKILRNCSTLLYLTRKTREEMVADGKDAGNMKLKVHANRNGEIMMSDEYINLNLFGGKGRMEQAKIPYTSADGSIPY